MFQCLIPAFFERGSVSFGETPVPWEKMSSTLLLPEQPANTVPKPAALARKHRHVPVQQPTPSRAVRNRLRPAACPPCSSGRAPRHLTTASIVRNFEEKYQGTPQVKNWFPSLQLASKCGRSSPARSPVRGADRCARQMQHDDLARLPHI